MTGSLRQRGPDRWELRVGAGRDPVTGKYRQVSRTFRGNKRAAQRALAQLASETHQERAVATAGTLGHLLDRWLAQGERLGRSPTTLRTYKAYIDRNIIPALGAIPLRRLSAADLDGFYASLAALGRRPATIHQHHAILSAALSQARKWGWVSHNVAELASPPPLNQREVVPPTPEEVRRLLEGAEARNPELAVLLFVAATTGARRGELCALRWSDVDGTSLVIRRALVDLPGVVTQKDTKTHRARRLALDPATIALLAAHLERQQELAGEDGLVSDPYVFSQQPDGSQPYRPDRVSGFFRRLRRELGLEHITLHHLRHFMATQALASGADLRTVAGRLGHSGGGAITLRVYSHFVEARDQALAETMGQLVSGEPKTP